MIPQGNLSTTTNVEVDTTRTYKILDDKIQGVAEELKALEQSIYKVLMTEKYEYPIYSFGYGIELDNLIGKDVVYVKIELERRIKECLLEDERIIGVDNFTFNYQDDALSCVFNVQSIYGNLDVYKEVMV